MRTLELRSKRIKVQWCAGTTMLQSILLTCCETGNDIFSRLRHFTSHIRLSFLIKKNPLLNCFLLWFKTSSLRLLWFILSMFAISAKQVDLQRLLLETPLYEMLPLPHSPNYDGKRTVKTCLVCTFYHAHVLYMFEIL